VRSCSVREQKQQERRKKRQNGDYLDCTTLVVLKHGCFRCWNSIARMEADFTAVLDS
jgi:hypothetical protein